jgi:hypothetical protein
MLTEIWNTDYIHTEEKLVKEIIYTHLSLSDRWNTGRTNRKQNISHNTLEFHTEFKFKFYYHHKGNQQPCSLNPEHSCESRET